MHIGNIFPYLDWSKTLTELVKPVQHMNCFLDSEIEEAISLNLKKKHCKWKTSFWMA